MNEALDTVDLRLLSLLQADARTSNKDLAEAVGLAPSSCLERVRQLRRDGVLAGFHAEIDARSMGANLQALVMVRLDKHSRDSCLGFRDHALALREVLGVYVMGGAFDVMVHVAAPDTDYLRDLTLDQITTFPEVVHIETLLVFEHWTTHDFPYFGNAEGGNST